MISGKTSHSARYSATNPLAPKKRPMPAPPHLDGELPRALAEMQPHAGTWRDNSDAPPPAPASPPLFSQFLDTCQQLWRPVSRHSIWSQHPLMSITHATHHNTQAYALASHSTVCQAPRKGTVTTPKWKSHHTRGCSTTDPHTHNPPQRSTLSNSARKTTKALDTSSLCTTAAGLPGASNRNHH